MPLGKLFTLRKDKHGQKYCAICGEKFIGNNNALYCPSCKIDQIAKYGERRRKRAKLVIK